MRHRSQPFDGYESHKSRNRQHRLCMEILSRKKPYKPRAGFRVEPTIGDNFRSRRTFVQRSNVFYRVAACNHLAAWVFACFFDVDNSDQSGAFSVFSKRITIVSTICNQTFGAHLRPTQFVARHFDLGHHLVNKGYFVRGCKGNGTSRRNTFALFLAGAKLLSMKASSQSNKDLSSGSAKNLRHTSSQTPSFPHSPKRRRMLTGLDICWADPSKNPPFAESKGFLLTRLGCQLGERRHNPFEVL